MCGVIGIHINMPTREDYERVRMLFAHSEIRGLHATGISYRYKGNIHTVVSACSASLFALHFLDDNFLQSISQDGSLTIIGHCRYSTSDLQYHQPISTNTKSIVHNGVVTQQPFGEWVSPDDKEFQTRNDSEFILKSDDPLRDYPEASIAACEMTLETFRFYRNGKRPLYYANDGRCLFVASTRDILKRTGINGVYIEASNMVYYTHDGSSLVEDQVETDKKDYQNE